MESNGLITAASKYSVAETMDRLAAAVVEKGLNVFARIGHSAGAAAAGLDLRPTELLLFGHAKGGTPLMQEQQTAGLDLPLKVLAWEDAAGQVWLTFNDPAWLARRHGLGGANENILNGMKAMLAAVVQAAAQ